MLNSGKLRLPRLGAMALAIHATLGGLSAWALPQGGVVVNGQVTISQTAPGSQVINASHGAIINWRQFSIGAGETTQFIQPNSASAVLNRVVGPDMSQLLGQLKANGHVFLINPHGIVVGGGARIDTNSFLASTLDMTDTDFLAGKLRFFAGSTAGRVRNDGMITAGPGGRIALIAPDIQNTGIIHAPDGQILLAAGRKLEIASMDMEGVTFEIQAPTDSVLNLGKLLAENGAVHAFAGSLRHSGAIQAGRMVRDGDGSIILAGSNDLTLTSDSSTRADGVAGGSIVLQSADGVARVSGQVSATGSAGAGGDIRILGERVALDAGARIDTSGSAGGGQILVGGDFQGRNAEVQNASRVHVAAGAQLRADATENGDGGRVIVWADQDTRYYGSLSARGGALGGDGGFAEVSGKRNLEFAGAADLRAPAGASGTLMLDPLDLIVSLTSGLLPIVVDEFADFPGNVVTVSPTTLAAVGANVILQALRDVYIKDELVLTAPGAGVTITAGGELFDGGSIFNNAGIRTNAGAVVLRGDSISGAGGITTAGGAVDLLTFGSLGFGGQITSGGGAVTLAAQNGSVNSAQVDAGSGAIQVTGQSGVFGGSYITSGVVSLNATSGSVSVNEVHAGTANFTATSNVNATVNATDRVNATSSASYVQLYDDGAPLRLGTVTGSSGLYLYSSSGFEQAPGGVLTGPFIDIYAYGGTVPVGTPAAPLTIGSPGEMAQTRIGVYGMEAPLHLAFSGSPTLSGLSLDGTVAAIGASTVAFGATANLSALALSTSPGVLNVSATATGGFANGFDLSVDDGGINAATLDFPNAPVDLTANTTVTVGTMTGGSLSINARGAVNIASATTTGNRGISVYTQSCSNSNIACAAVSPITAGTLSAGGSGDVDLYTYDNGAITVTNLMAGDDIDIRAGQVYSTSFGFPFTSQATSNSIQLGTVVSGDDIDVNNRGDGNVTITSLSAGGDVYLQAGSNFTPSQNNFQVTNNTITVGNTEPPGATSDFQIYNSGNGDITVTGAVDRTASGSIYLYAQSGSVTATSNLSARDYIYVDAGSGNVTLGQLVAGLPSGDGNIDVYSGGDLTFTSASATALGSFSGNVNLVSYNGAVRTTVDNTAADIMASGNVSVSASTAIGDGAFTNPLDIRAGAGKVVTLSAGTDIGALGNAVTVDTDGSLTVTSTNGQFHVVATDGVLAKSLSSISLSASADGIGMGNQSTFTSLDLDVTAASDGSVITIGDLERSAGTLNLFQFNATGGSGMVFGNVDLATTGLNQLVLSAGDGLTQTTPLTNGITAGTANLSGSAGAVEFGAVMARSLRASGAGLSTRAITTTGTIRSTSGATPDTLTMSSSAGILVTGDLHSATVIDVNSGGGDLTVTGAVTGTGATRNTFRAAPDQVRLQASGNINTGGAVTSQTSTSVIAGGSVTVGGAGIDGGTTAFFGNNLSDTVTVTAGPAGSITTQSITHGFFKTITGGTLNIAGGVSGAANSTTINATTFNTGNLATSGALTINATGAYAPSAVALSATGRVTIEAPDGIDLQTGQSSLTAPTVSMTTVAGDIAAVLTNTTNLTINTGGRFNVGSSGTLNNLNVTADGTVAGAGQGSSVNAGDGTQALTYVTNGAALALGLESSASTAYRYAESSAAISDIAITTTGIFSPSGGSVNVSAPVANITTPSVMLGSTSLTLSTDGDVTLTSLSTTGGSVNVFSGAGTVNLTSVSTSGGSVTARTAGDDTRHVNVQGVTTLGGSVTLTSDNGDIVRAGALPLQIDTRNGASAASGTISLSAANGSVGTGVTPILTSGAVTLNVNAMDDIAVDAANTAVTNLNLTTAASGAGAIAITNSNFAGFSLTRSGGVDLHLGALTPVAPGALGAFSLTATDGNIRVLGDIGNLNNLGLNAGRGFNSSGDLIIQAATGVRTVGANNFTLQAGRDVLIAAGAAPGDNVVVAQTGGFGGTSVQAGRNITVMADGGSALLAHVTGGNTQFINAGGDLQVLGGSAGTAATAAITATGFQSISASNNLLVQGGGSDQASARIAATQNQGMTNILGTIQVLGGTGVDAFAEIASSASNQQLGTTGSGTDTITVQGGSGAGAYASIRAFGSQNVMSSEDVRVIGGAGTGANAEIRAGTSQTVGSTSTFFNDPTAAILVQAGAGGTATITAGTGQTILAGDGISVLGGTGTGMSATIETTAGGQTIGSSGTFRNDPTADILVQAGTGDGALAAIRASGSQTINTGGLISVLGNSGMGASAEVLSSTGSQSIGSTSTNSNDPTGSILVRAGSGGTARIQAQGSQTIRSGGDLSVIGGDGANLTASIEAVTGSQSIGQTGVFSNDSSDAVLVQAGTATGAAAWIRAATGQNIDAGGSITLAGGPAGAFAEISTAAGSQTIGNLGFSSDQTDSISLTGGSAAGAFARIFTGGTQTLNTSANLALVAGVGDASGAMLLSGTGQSLNVRGNLSMLGGSGSAPGLNETAIRNATSGSQNLSVSGSVAITGGGFGSDTWIKQNGSGSQFISAGGDLALLAPAGTPGTGVTSIEAGAGGQTLSVGGAMTVNNQGGWLTYVGSGGAQSINAATLAVNLSSTNGANPFAGLTATGAQNIQLQGDGMTPGSATLSVVNLSPAAGSLAAVRTMGDQTILMNYDAAGLVTIGSTAGQGAATISAAGDLTMVAGQLLLQGGATAGSDARLLSGDQPPAALTGTMLISTLYGPVQLQGGAGGGAYIDPLHLSVVSNGSVLLQAGVNAGSDTNINAGTLDLAATLGDVSLINSTTSSATASITAGTFNLVGAGNLNLIGGTVVVTDPSTVDLVGACNNCGTNLIPADLFQIRAYVPPPTDFGEVVTAELLALFDLSTGMFEMDLDEDGTPLFTRRRLSQCY